MKTSDSLQVSHKVAATSCVSDEDFSADAEMSNIPSRHKKPPPHPTRSGTVSCLRCGERFKSWDKTRNRICPACAGRSW